MRRRHVMISAVVIIAIVFGLATALTTDNETPVQAQGDGEFTYAGEVDAPPFPEDLDWVNATEGLDWNMLEGKIVLLDFWTYGCINCIHVIPDLERLEEEYGDSLVVIGVHSAKFDNEGNTTNIKQIVQRYGVTHPVVNDNDFAIWQTYGVRAWPTTVLIDPLGRVVGGRSGEGVYDALQPIIEIMQEEYGEAGLLNSGDIPVIQPEVTAREEIVLNYPGKVLADTEGNRLIIADSSNHRIVITDLDDYDNTIVIGDGTQGFTNGDFELAKFNLPQGLAIDGDTLYVADTGNHAIRQIDLEQGLVTTLVGTGEQADTYPPLSGTAPDVQLSSPWDLTLHDGILYIAMAGPHQLWKINLETFETEPHAGNAREDIIDGPLSDAQLAQPSGITNDGELLYFADSEVSAVRTASIDPDGTVETIVGTGLFDFGDVDGVGDEVRLQHVLGVTVGEDGILYIADTYNNKIKIVDPAERSSTTFAGTGEASLADGSIDEAAFFEPGGVDYADGKLYVADTNNHAIRVIDIESGTVETVEFPDITALILTEDDDTATDLNTPSFGTPGDDNIVAFDPITVPAGEGEIVFDIIMPEGYDLNDQAPFTAFIENTDEIILDEGFNDFREVTPELPVRIPATFEPGDTQFNAELTIYWCEVVNYTLCFIERVSLQAPVNVAESSGSAELTLSYELVPPVLD